MTNDQFLSFLKSYYKNTEDGVLFEIGKRTNVLSFSARDELKDAVIESFSNRFGRISVKEICEAAQSRGISFERKTERKNAFWVKCPCCGNKYEYNQGYVDECPECQFQYYEHFSFIDAPGEHRQGPLGDYYRSKIRFHRELATILDNEKKQLPKGQRDTA
ncbi:hypothetical protein [Marispirochaeta sp.]|uniref:hypothetical protein n=1 Tax=Marispirochaeta sp. TaxID=2038653 RepID=UPI0029C89C55|nr:hypothetical protein [Marispirochaeta sp.]